MVGSRRSACKGRAGRPEHVTFSVEAVGLLRRVLRLALLLSLAGIVFSGTLTYRELGGSGASCPAPGASGTTLGYPACLYGLAMYAVLAVLSAWALVISGPPRRIEP